MHAREKPQKHQEPTITVWPRPYYSTLFAHSTFCTCIALGVSFGIWEASPTSFGYINLTYLLGNA